ncbi:hypothetical protein CPR19088_GLDEOEPO_02492 [Companilactobacillus paralimentarius]
MNQKKLKNIIFIFSIITLSVYSFFIFTDYTIIAEDVTNPDFENALKTAPKGLNWDNQAFKIADFKEAAKNSIANNGSPTSSTSTLINKAKIISSKNPNNKNTSIIQMTNGDQQTGAVWSNWDKDNYFDISIPQKASMWLYFGTIEKGPTVRPGDGMAFVLQNDLNGPNSIALSNKLPVNGQGLGVWGADWNALSDSSKVASTAIKNSWALEFDTFVDYRRVPGEGVFFDGGMNQWSDSHITGNYPANAKTYINEGGYFSMDHTSKRIYAKLVDSNWHHVTIDWSPSKKTLTYTYNDKDPKTGKHISVSPIPYNNHVSPEYATKVSFNIDTSEFHLDDGQKKLYWGFTGSTGKHSENNLLIFESIPSYVDAEATSAIYDDSNGSKLVDGNYHIDPDSDIRYVYSLKYKGWTKKWNNIQANIDIPNGVTFTSGTITYPNSSINNKPRPIPSEIFNSKNITKAADGNNKLVFQLPEQLSHESTDAKIELKGTTKKIVPTEIKVPSVIASFEGDNLITDTTTNPFTINSRALILTSNSKDIIDVDENTDVKIQSNVSYTNGTSPKYKNMSVYLKFNNKSNDAVKYENIGKIVDNNGNFTLSFPADKLAKINTLSFYVDDNNGNQSNIIKKQINVGGLLSFDCVQENVNFKTINDSYKDQIVTRSGTWQIYVHDSRPKNNRWYVTASSSPLIADNKYKTPLDGKLFFRNSDGYDVDIPSTPKKGNINSNLVTVASHTKTIDDSEYINIADFWNSNNGILLFLKKGNPVGKYTSQITWSLTDSM